MAGAKVTLEVTLTEKHLEWLDHQAAQFDLPGRDKALRRVLDFATIEPDPNTIFGIIRCPQCKPGEPCTHTPD